MSFWGAWLPVLLKTDNPVRLVFSLCLGNSLKFVNRTLCFCLNHVSVTHFENVMHVHMGGFFVCLDCMDSENKAIIWRWSSCLYQDIQKLPANNLCVSQVKRLERKGGAYPGNLRSRRKVGKQMQSKKRREKKTNMDIDRKGSSEESDCKIEPAKVNV